MKFIFATLAATASALPWEKETMCGFDAACGFDVVIDEATGCGFDVRGSSYGGSNNGGDDGAGYAQGDAPGGYKVNSGCDGCAACRADNNACESCSGSCPSGNCGSSGCRSGSCGNAGANGNDWCIGGADCDASPDMVAGGNACDTWCPNPSVQCILNALPADFSLCCIEEKDGEYSQARNMVLKAIFNCEHTAATAQTWRGFKENAPTTASEWSQSSRYPTRSNWVRKPSACPDGVTCPLANTAWGPWTYQHRYLSSKIRSVLGANWSTSCCNCYCNFGCTCDCTGDCGPCGCSSCAGNCNVAGADEAGGAHVIGAPAGSTTAPVTADGVPLTTDEYLASSYDEITQQFVTGGGSGVALNDFSDTTGSVGGGGSGGEMNVECGFDAKSQQWVDVKCGFDNNCGFDFECGFDAECGFDVVKDTKCGFDLQREQMGCGFDTKSDTWVNVQCGFDNNCGFDIKA